VRAPSTARSSSKAVNHHHEIVFGAIAARIWCELLIVLFRMNEALQEMRRK